MSSTSVELDVHALFQNIGTQATKRYFLPRLGRVAYFSRYKVGLNEVQPNARSCYATANPSYK
ncbi:MAG: hypothetical protein EWV85_08160 [Microcystis aeruginosa Ma_QC_C_20070703_M131]|uniref:Uncharacterized protein n=1 Tax=Microcystis aeruginosa Ma_QC_C_20070703_M131 TaxID=2486263 RepID=A0A551Y633_MICAE|nr:MAG: hypothetical protein EWV85_08160 [Microcystis aeruginosa Ma_QC_C_20070703_M131]